MRLLLSFIFLTFVLFAPQLRAAAPSSSKPGYSKKTWEKKSDEGPDPTKTEPTNTTYPKNYDISAKTPRPPKIYAPGGKDLNAYGGILSGDILENSDQLTALYIGLRYIPNSNLEESWDFSVEAHNKNIVNTSVGHRWLIDESKLYRPYYRIALNNYINANDNLAGLINIRHMKAMAAIGCTDVFYLDRRLLIEVGVGYGMSGFASYAQGGFNFNF